MSELARRAQLSVSHFSAAFRRDTGVGVVEYVKRLRMARARFLLSATDQPVAEIATAVGYGDPFYFSRQFKKVVGQSPAQFRQAARSTEAGGKPNQ
ncbi:AraC family transcriptional regulator [Kineosporia babensis]|uniref:AraC family transcriptional regulator n=1 Tax=Kineosporia babensis TaxID=499548 RepID=A0A9X1SVU2_9ACTN|nr:AraC family transcriptional regulator [Kineosporia babensis]